MTNNDILKKLRVALHLRNDEIIEILKLVDFNITLTELGAFFRTEDHRNYRPCGDQVLRNFLDGLIVHMRGKRADDNATENAAPGAENAGGTEAASRGPASPTASVASKGSAPSRGPVPVTGPASSRGPAPSPGPSRGPTALKTPTAPTGKVNKPPRS